jgi:hypothetical protein
MCAPSYEKHEGTPQLRARGVPWRPLVTGSPLELLYLLFPLGLALACVIPSLPAPGKATSLTLRVPFIFPAYAAAETGHIAHLMLHMHSQLHALWLQALELQQRLRSWQQC